MVVYSVAIITKTGKTLCARQFAPMNKLRIEGYLAAFPKLLGTDSQHTFVETEQVRYVYQPIEQLYMVLITSKASNIIEDLDTLRLLVKLVPEYCGGNTEEHVSKAVFELIFAIDEVISLGYKETVTLAQIKTFTEMDSHEERLQKIIDEGKMNEAREQARKRAEDIDKKKRDESRDVARRGPSGYAGGRGPYDEEGPRVGSRAMGSAGGGGGGYGNEDDGPVEKKTPGKKDPRAAPASAKKAAPVSASKPIKGMQLGRAKPGQDDFMMALSKEENLTAPPAAAGGSAAAGGGGAVAAAYDKVNVLVEEKLDIALERDGAIKKIEIKGQVKLSIFDPTQASVQIHTTGAVDAHGFRSTLHPKIDKNVYAKDGILQLKDAKGFPLGAANSPVILRWRVVTTEESELPFTINLWPNTEDGWSVVNVEVQHVKEGLTCQNVYVSIPCPPQELEVTNATGQHHYDKKEKALVWMINELSDSAKEASLEFKVPEADGDAFFPINISFTAPTTYAPVQVTAVTMVEDGKPVEFVASAGLSTEKFIVE